MLGMLKRSWRGWSFGAWNGLKLQLAVRQSHTECTGVAIPSFHPYESSFFASMGQLFQPSVTCTRLTGLSLDEMYTSWRKHISPEGSSQGGTQKSRGFILTGRDTFLICVYRNTIVKILLTDSQTHLLLDILHVQTLHVTDQFRSEQHINCLFHAIGGSLKHFKTWRSKEFWSEWSEFI